MKDFLDLHALADGHLTGQEKADAQARLESCSKSKAEFENVALLKDVLKSKAANHTCEKTWSECVSRLDEMTKKRSVERFVSKYAWAMCLGITMVIGVAGMFNRNTGGTQVGTGDVARMVAGLAPMSQRAPSSSIDMGEWLRNASNGAPVNAPSQLRVVSYSNGLFDDKEVSVVNLIDSTGPVSLITVKGADKVDGVVRMERSAYSVGQIERVNCVTWTDGGFSFILAGNRGYDELTAIADSVRPR